MIKCGISGWIATTLGVLGHRRATTIYINLKIRKLIQLLVLTGINSLAYAQGGDNGNHHAVSLAGYLGSGDFGLSRNTDIQYFPVRYEYDNSNWGFQALVPYLKVEGPGAVLINLGGVNQAVAGDEVTQESGLGDIVGSVIYHVPATDNSALFLDVRLDIKLPTADENKALGSGELDLNLQLDASRYWRELLLFASVGYSVRGNSTLFPDLKDGAYLQLGAARSLTESISVGALIDYREAASTLTDDIAEAGPYVNWQLDDNWSFTAFSLFGFTDASVDYSVLGQLRFSF